MGIVYGPKWPFYSCCDYIGLLGTGFMQVLYLGRAPRTKETLPNFLKWRRVTRHPLVFRGLTGSQRTPGFGVSQTDFPCRNKNADNTRNIVATRTNENTVVTLKLGRDTNLKKLHRKNVATQLSMSQHNRSSKNT